MHWPTALHRNAFREVLRNFWRGFRDWCGDSAYERYLASRAARESGLPRLTREDFYVQQLNRRYSRPNRCC
jgi:uncharacterized short protein YbdD (DUF466 family)